MRRFAWLVTALALAIVVSPAYAQTTTERLAGCFTDPNNPSQQAAARDAISTMQKQGWTDADIRIALALARQSRLGVTQIASLRWPDSRRASTTPTELLDWELVFAQVGVAPGVLGGLAALPAPGAVVPAGGGFTAQPARVLQALAVAPCSPVMADAPSSTPVMDARAPKP